MDPSRHVVLTGVPVHTSEADIHTLLQDYGRLVVRHQHDSTWHVSFDSVEYAQVFVEASFDDFVIHGAAVALDYLPSDRRGASDRRRHDESRRSRSTERGSRDRRLHDRDSDRPRERERDRDRDRERDRERGRERSRERSRERGRQRDSRERGPRDRDRDREGADGDGRRRRRYDDGDRRRDDDSGRDGRGGWEGRGREGSEPAQEREVRGRERARDFDRESRERPPADWLCPACGGVNFARRLACFQCGADLPRDAAPVPAGTAGSAYEPDVPVLMVKLLKETTTEAEIATAFSQFGAVKEVRAVPVFPALRRLSVPAEAP